MGAWARAPPPPGVASAGAEARAHACARDVQEAGVELVVFYGVREQASFVKRMHALGVEFKALYVHGLDARRAQNPRISPNGRGSCTCCSPRKPRFPKFLRFPGFPLMPGRGGKEKCPSRVTTSGQISANGGPAFGIRVINDFLTPVGKNGDP